MIKNFKLGYICWLIGVKDIYVCISKMLIGIVIELWI